MSLRKIQTVPLIQAEELHRSLGITEPFEDWLKELFHDERFIGNYDYWTDGNDRLIDEPQSGQTVYIGMYMAKILALEQNSPRGEKAYKHFLEFGQVRGFVEILNIRESIPANNQPPLRVERPKMTVV